MVVVMKSTVPPGTGRTIVDGFLAGTGIGYATNPEFLSAGQALADWDFPDRIVIGTEPGDTRSLEAVRRLYGNIDSPVAATDITTAEMIKYASNAFLATRISFMNEIASICDQVGASIDDVSQGLALDSRNGTKPRPRWDVHSPEAGKWAGNLAGVLRPLTAGPSGSGASPRLSG